MFIVCFINSTTYLNKMFGNLSKINLNTSRSKKNIRTLFYKKLKVLFLGQIRSNS